MKKYIFFGILVFATRQSWGMGEDISSEIAINSRGTVKSARDTQGALQFRIPIAIYRYKRFTTNASIPLDTLAQKNDGDVVSADLNGGDIRRYRCNQNHASGNQKFQDALKKVLAKKNN